MLLNHEEAHRLYTKTFTRTELVGWESVTYQPQCPANKKEMNLIFEAVSFAGYKDDSLFMERVVELMRTMVGKPGPVEEKRHAMVKDRAVNEAPMPVVEACVVGLKDMFEAIVSGMTLQFVK